MKVFARLRPSFSVTPESILYALFHFHLALCWAYRGYTRAFKIVDRTVLRNCVIVLSTLVENVTSYFAK